MTKVCPKCGVEKELTEKEWYRDRTHKDGFQSRCKDCKRQDFQNWFKLNKEAVHDEHKRYYAGHKDQWLMYSRRRKEKQALYKRERRIYYSALQRVKSREHIRKLEMPYIKAQLRAKGLPLTPLWIERQRASIKLYRNIKEIKNGSAYQEFKRHQRRNEKAHQEEDITG